MVDIPFVGSVICNPDTTSLAEVDLHMSVENSVDWSKVHRADPELTSWIIFVERGSKPLRGEISSIVLGKIFDQLVLKDVILYWNILVYDQSVQQLVVPKSQVSIILQALHDEMGDQGRDRTINTFSKRKILLASDNQGHRTMGE